MKNLIVDSTWKFNQYTNKKGLKGIFTKNVGELPCQDKYLVALAENGDIVAQVSYEVTGNKYRWAQKQFGDQLEKALGDRMGY